MRLQLGSETDSGDGLTKDKPEILAIYLSQKLAEETGISPLTSKLSSLLTDATTGLAIASQALRSNLASSLILCIGLARMAWPLSSRN